MDLSEAKTVARVKLRDKGQITLPQQVREALQAEEGDQVEFVVDADGTVTLRGLRLIATDQAWFWTPAWQTAEREASAQIADGDVHRFDSGADLLKALGG